MGGDDDAIGRQWSRRVDSCKTCCRDPQWLAPVMKANLQLAIGEYSLNTGFPTSEAFLLEYMKDQLSLFKHLGMVGSFFWNHRIARSPIDNVNRYRQMSLLDLLDPSGPFNSISDLYPQQFCAGQDIEKC